MRIIDNESVKYLKEKSADNLILVDKPVDWSSFDVVKKIRYQTRIRKVGHSGTLDPFASGLLILGTGKETKTLSHIVNVNKEYIATLQLGECTDTFDRTGNRLVKNQLNGIDSYDFEPVLNSFIGEINQIPPMFSAKKINGKRLYKIARQGKEIERKPQKVTIYAIDVLKREGSQLAVHIQCSKGTYIRSLANDIGQKCGYGAYLKDLRRVAIGQFIVDKALSIQDFGDYWSSLS